MLFFLVSSKTILAAVWCATVYCRNCRSTVVPWVLPLSCRSTDLNTSTMSLRKFQVFRETASQMCLVPPAVACCHLLFFTDWVFCLEKFWFQNLSRVTTMVRHLYWLIMLVLLTWWQYNFSFSVSIVRIKSKWPMPPSPPKKKNRGWDVAFTNGIDRILVVNPFYYFPSFFFAYSLLKFLKFSDFCSYQEMVINLPFCSLSPESAVF